MIITGGQAGNVGWWAQHLQREDTNDRAEVKEVSGLLATDLPTGLREMQAVAAGSRSHGNFMYQANLNPEAHEHLTPEQWTEAVDILEKKLGFEGHQRVVVEHEKHGRVHRHVIWNRVDVDTLKVADITNNYAKHTKASFEIAQRFDLTPTPTPSRAQKPDRAPELWEIRAAERSGIDRDQIKQDVTEAWHTTDSGKAFAAAIAERGYILARGDRRDFCIVDHAGDAHSLARRIDGAKAKDVRERMADIDPASLPSVAEARTKQDERNPTPEAARAAWEGRQPAAAPSAAREAKGQPAPTAEPPARDRTDKGQAAWRSRRDAELARVTDRSPPQERSPLRVVDTATGVIASLGSFVDSLLGSRPPEPSDNLARIRAQRRALAAMENFRDSMERGENLRASDVAALTPSHLMNIKANGDDAIRQMIEDVERRRARDQDYGRTRGR
jgi:hypothetical protein